MKVFDALATVVAAVLEWIHRALSTVLPEGSGWAWGLSIVLLTVSVRLLILPLAIKQMHSMRRMQEIAPKVKALQAKHKGDRETLNVELMKLYKEHNTNPVSGCLPMVLQLPIFFALFRVMNEFRPHFHADGSPYFKAKYGLSQHLIEQGAHAKVFGAPISAAFTSGPKVLDVLHGNATTIKVVAALMIVTMGVTTFISQRQMMARAGVAADPQQAQVQKILLYVMPLSFGVFGFSFPVGVLLYWLTTNLWSMGQQRYVARSAPATGGKNGGKNGDKGGAGGDTGPRTPTPGGGAAPAQAAPPPAERTGEPPRAQSRAAAGSRKNKKRRGGRR